METPPPQDYPNFATLVDQSKRMLPYYDYVFQHRSVALQAEADGGFSFIRDDAGDYEGNIDSVENLGVTAMIELFLSVQVFGGGPKVYRPTPTESEALAQVRAEVSLSEYRQPFPTFVVEIARDWAETMRNEDSGYPIAVFTYFDSTLAFLLAGVQWSKGFSTTLAGTHAPGFSIEAFLARQSGRQWDGSLDYPPDEAGVTERCIRMAVNACLLLTMYGCRHLGRANPEHAARLEKYIKKKNQHTEANKLELKEMPVIYGFDQSVRLYDREQGTHEGSESGRLVKPHWRRGHYRMQRHGHELTEVKKIFVRPTMVRIDQFGGAFSSSSVAYSRAERARNKSNPGEGPIEST